jgi:hypothetical protein
MKKLIPAIMLLALGLSSCAVKTVSRKELLTPTLATAMDSSELTDMKYYGSDAEYDYFTRSYTRYRVLKSENCLPERARFTFNNWMGGKKYTDCLKESTVSKLQSILSGTYQAETLPTTTTTTTLTPAQQQRAQALQSFLQSFSQQ